MTQTPYAVPSSSFADSASGGSETELDPYKKRLAPMAAWLIGLALVSVLIDLIFLCECLFLATAARTMHLGVPEWTLLLTFHSLQLLGGMQLRAQRSFWLAYTAAWTCCIPGLSPLLILGMPFGVWAIRVLNEPGSKPAFRR